MGPIPEHEVKCHSTGLKRPKPAPSRAEGGTHWHSSLHHIFLELQISETFGSVGPKSHGRSCFRPNAAPNKLETNFNTLKRQLCLLIVSLETLRYINRSQHALGMT